MTSPTTTQTTTATTEGPAEAAIILTQNQWLDRWVRTVAAEYECTLVEAAYAPPTTYEYLRYAVDAFDAGAEFTTRHWRSLNPNSRTFLFRHSDRFLKAAPGTLVTRYLHLLP